MQQEYKLLYKDMRKDIERCLHLELDEKDRIVSCFRRATNYWERLKSFLKNKVFKDTNEEIHFFRIVKPQFTHHIEYFLVLNEATLFVPAERKGAVEYWEKELRRYRRFRIRNEEFVNYYESNCRSRDSNYFLRNKNLACNDSLYILYNTDKSLCASHDQVIRNYLALKKYDRYVRERIENLQ